MQQKSFFRTLAYVSLFVVVSCNQETESLLDNKTPTTNLSSARRSKGIPDDKIKPIWEKAIYLKNFVEVPYLYDGKLRRPKSEKGSNGSTLAN